MKTIHNIYEEETGVYCDSYLKKMFVEIIDSEIERHRNTWKNSNMNGAIDDIAYLQEQRKLILKD